MRRGLHFRQLKRHLGRVAGRRDVCHEREPKRAALSDLDVTPRPLVHCRDDIARRADRRIARHGALLRESPLFESNFVLQR